MRDLGQSQGREIEAIRPVHHLASAEARKRGTQPLYESMVLHTDAVLARMAHPQPKSPLTEDAG